MPMKKNTFTDKESKLLLDIIVIVLVFHIYLLNINLFMYLPYYIPFLFITSTLK